jgi:hypothetical protein
LGPTSAQRLPRSSGSRGIGRVKAQVRDSFGAVCWLGLARSSTHQAPSTFANDLDLVGIFFHRTFIPDASGDHDVAGRTVTP